MGDTRVFCIAPTRIGVSMFHKIKYVQPLQDFKLCVQFCEGVTKIYNVSLLFEKIDVFNALKNDINLFLKRK